LKKHGSAFGFKRVTCRFICGAVLLLSWGNEDKSLFRRSRLDLSWSCLVPVFWVAGRSSFEDCVEPLLFFPGGVIAALAVGLRRGRWIESAVCAGLLSFEDDVFLPLYFLPSVLID